MNVNQRLWSKLNPTTQDNGGFLGLGGLSYYPPNGKIVDYAVIAGTKENNLQNDTSGYFTIYNNNKGILTPNLSVSSVGNINIPSANINGLIQANTGKFGNVSGGNYSEYEADGTLVNHGTATTHDDLLGDITRVQVVGVGIVQDNTENCIKFQTTANLSDYALSNYQIRHRWKNGSGIYPHIHFEQTKNNIPNFLIRYRWQRQGQTKTTAWTDYKCNTLVFTYVSGTLDQIAYGAAITPPVGYGISDIIQFRIFRDNTNASGVFTGVDAFTTDVNVTGIDIHIEEDTLGSRTQYSK